jgi:mono/diheme cytochrome c family protein
VKKLTTALAVLVAVMFAVAACSKNQESSTSQTSSQATTAPEAMASTMQNAKAMANSVAAKLPIPLAKLPSQAVAAGNASAGAQVFAAQCASCHGEGGKNGTVGPTLAGAGLKAGQVAYMVRHPQGVDKDSAMPPLPLTDKQLADVAAYVASLK